MNIFLMILLALLPLLLQWLLPYIKAKKMPPTDQVLFLQRHMLFAKDTLGYLNSHTDTLTKREIKHLAKAQALYDEIKTKGPLVGCDCG